MSTLKTVIVLGGTGHVGRAIVDALLNAKFNVTIVTRNAAVATQQPSAATIVSSDYSEESLAALFIGQDAVVSAVAAGPAIMAQKTMINAAAKAGVSRFIPSEYGSSSLEQPLQDFRKLMAPKTEIITYLRETASRYPSFSWSCISGGACLNIGLKSGVWGFSQIDKKAIIFDTGMARFDASTLPFMAKAVVSVLQKPLETVNKYLLIRSFVITPIDVLNALEDISGSKWKVTHLESKKTLKEGWKLLEDGKPEAGIPKIVQGALFNDKTRATVSPDRLSNRLLELPNMDLREYIRSLLASPTY